MRIVFIGQPRDRFSGTGSEFGSVAIVLRNIADRIARGAEVHVIAPIGPGEAAEEVTASGVTVHRVPARGRHLFKAVDLIEGLGAPSVPLFYRRAYYAGFRKRAVALVARLRPDVVHVMSLPEIARDIDRLHPRPAVMLHLHDEGMLRLPQAKVSAWLQATDRVLTCSSFIADHLARLHPQLAGRIRCIGNGVDFSLFDRPADSEAQADRPFERILFIGRVSPEKGPHLLVDAFVRLAAAWPGLTLDLVGPAGLLPWSYVHLIAGDPEMASALPFYGHGLAGRLDRQVLHARTSLVDALRARIPAELRERVRLPGSLPQHELAGLMDTNTLFVQPSLCQEGFGLPLAEAMACGLPVVACRRGGITDLVEDGRNGRLVPAGDVDALVHAIDAQLRDPARARAMGRAAASDIRRRFSWDHVSERLEREIATLRSEAVHHPRRPRTGSGNCRFWNPGLGCG
ncbi:MAG: glycosyltransferase family 4 protein [Geminicoccaceae bacterium]